MLMMDREEATTYAFMLSRVYLQLDISHEVNRLPYLLPMQPVPYRYWEVDRYLGRYGTTGTVLRDFPYSASMLIFSGEPGVCVNVDNTAIHSLEGLLPIQIFPGTF